MSKAENPTYDYKRLTTSGIVCKEAGLLGGFLVASGTATVALYDGTDNTGTPILGALTTASGMSCPLPVQFQNGLYAEITGTSDVTFYTAV